jgi:predicted esterase
MYRKKAKELFNQLHPVLSKKFTEQTSSLIQQSPTLRDLQSQLERDFHANKSDKSTQLRWEEFLINLDVKTRVCKLNFCDVGYVYIPQSKFTKDRKVIFICPGLPGVSPLWSKFVKEIRDISDVVLIHPAGYYPSTGHKTTNEIHQSIISAIPEIISKHALQDHSLILLGESMGGNVMANASTIVPCDMLILQKPMPSVAQAVGYNTSKENPEDTLTYKIFNYMGLPRLEDVLPKTQAKEVLMLIGSKDEVVSPTHQEQAFKALSIVHHNCELIKDPKGDHYSMDIDKVRMKIKLT